MSSFTFRQINLPLIAAGLSISALSSCSNRPDPDLPFDKNGNYVEEWDTDGTYAYEEPEAPDFYEEDTKPKTTSKPKKKKAKSTTSSSSKKKKKTTPKPKKVTPSYKTHTVAKGETLWRISQKYGTTVAHLKKINGIQGTLIRVGQQIKVPR